MLSIAVLVLLAALAVVTYPLFFQDVEAYRLTHPPDETFNEGNSLLEALSDLELAHGAGKLSQADYEQEKSRLEIRYIQVLEEKREKQE